MRKLLSLLIIFYTGMVKADVASHKNHSYKKEQFLHHCAGNTISSLQDSTPTTKRNGAILISRSTKLYDVIFFVVPEDEAPAQTSPNSSISNLQVTSRKPLLKISGNVLYDLNYRSRIDTPYAENNIYQHTIQTRLDLLYKDTYPLKLYFTSRFSNSPFFRNYTDFNVRFNPSDFKRIAKQQLIESAKQWLLKKSGRLDSLYHLIEAKKMALSSLRQSLDKPDLRQKIVEDREKELYNTKRQSSSLDIDEAKYMAIDSAKSVLKGKLTNKVFKSGDSTGNNFDTITATYTRYQDSLERKRQVIDSLERDLQKLEKQYRTVKSAGEQDFADLKRQIEDEKDVSKLTDKLHQLNLPDTVLPKGYKMLSGIQSLNIGRSMADYTELSVKNISITGLQVEYNPRYYYAIAIGKVDYRFRDYIVHNHTRTNQYVALFRFGKGTKNGNHVFLTYYTGKRQLFNASVAMQDSIRIPGYNLAGITIEGVYKINRNITVVGEIAKSTIPYFSLDSVQRNKWMNSIGKITSRSNEAYSVKLFSFFPKTLTRFTGNLIYTGADFQSFSTFTTGAAQLRWMARLEQPFFKKQLTVISTLQKNNYSNPFIATAYKSSSLLTSVQANLRVKKYPTVSLGYFPAYQLTKTGDNYYSESRYYTLTGSAGYAYRLQEAQLSSYIVYSRFYNETNDSGFVYYNSKNVLLSQSLNFKRYSLLINGSLSTGSDYTLRTLESSLQVYINKIISLGGGLKMISYNLLPMMQWGYSGNLTLNIPKVGDIQLMADKGFIPGVNKQLAENKTGRLIFYKTF